jgi:hypothetical protein
MNNRLRALRHLPLRDGCVGGRSTGQVKLQEDCAQGLERAPQVFIGMLEGRDRRAGGCRLGSGRS